MRLAGIWPLLAGVLGVPTLIALAMLPDFRHRLKSDPRPVPADATGVVFTGQFGRIETGLALFAEGRIAALLVSGVNSGAGTSTGRFPAQFGLDEAQQDALRDGRIVLGRQARNTLGNALETACWLRLRTAEHEPGGAVVLITARGHMPRASWLLEAVLPAQTPVLRLASGPDLPSHRLWTREFPRHVLLRLALLAPESLLRRLTGMPCPA